MNNSIQFQNVDNWRGNSSENSGLTFKQIILMHINRCVINGSTEWHGGYWSEIGYNPPTRTYVHNSRDVYNNSVRMLRALLLGYFDKETKEADAKLQKELTEAYENYLKSEDKKAKLEYYKIKTDIHIKLFEHLIILSKKLNFFEEQQDSEEQ